MLTITMQVNGHSHQGVACEIRFSKAGVELEAGFPRNLPVLPIRAHVQTKLKKKTSGKAAEQLGRFIFQSRTESAMRCTVFYGLEQLQGLGAVLNQCDTVRARPSVTEPVKGRVPEGVNVIVSDISCGGISRDRRSPTSSSSTKRRRPGSRARPSSFGPM